jgi:O-methyltransferase
MTFDIKAAIRDSVPVRVVQQISSGLIRRTPVENLPGWVGRFYGFQVPKGVLPLQKPSPSEGANIKIILDLAKSVLDLDGNLAECGVYRGGTLIPLGLYLAQTNVKKQLYGFDSFEGFGDLAEQAYLQTYGACTDTSYETVHEKISRLHLSEQVILIRGFFNDTLGAFRDRRFCFVHLDCDLYESYKVCLNFFYDRMVSGGIILLDEYNDPPCPGCNHAVDEFLLDKPETLIEIVSDNYIRYFIRKSAGSQQRH